MSDKPKLFLLILFIILFITKKSFSSSIVSLKLEKSLLFFKLNLDFAFLIM